MASTFALRGRCRERLGLNNLEGGTAVQFAVVGAAPGGNCGGPMVTDLVALFPSCGGLIPQFGPRGCGVLGRPSMSEVPDLIRTVAPK